jgi:hypothetical protein
MTHEQQLREAIKVVMELTTNSGYVIDDSDIMDGNIYITLCKPLQIDDEGPEYDGAGFSEEDRVVNGQYRVIDADMEAQDHDTFGNNKI